MINAGRAQRGVAGGWRVHFGFNVMVDFCLWVLQTDGLRLAPFDRHPEGPGLLRALGVDPETWREWLHAIVALQAMPADPRGALSVASPVAHAAPSADVRSVPDRFHPPAVWPGHPALRPWLAELWRQYGPLALDRRTGESLVGCSLVEHWLQETLSEFHPRLACLHIHLVRYPGPLVYPVPPHALILGIERDLQDHAELLALLRNGAAALAAA